VEHGDTGIREALLLTETLLRISFQTSHTFGNTVPQTSVLKKTITLLFRDRSNHGPSQ
jgi:hypothetical protein